MTTTARPRPPVLSADLGARVVVAGLITPAPPPPAFVPRPFVLDLGGGWSAMGSTRGGWIAGSQPGEPVVLRATLRDLVLGAGRPVVVLDRCGAACARVRPRDRAQALRLARRRLAEGTGDVSAARRGSRCAPMGAEALAALDLLSVLSEAAGERGRVYAAAGLI